jgi:hypothetical protein
VTCSAAAEQVTAWRRLESAPGGAVRRHARTARVLCEELYFAAGGRREHGRE